MACEMRGAEILPPPMTRPSVFTGMRADNGIWSHQEVDNSKRIKKVKQHKPGRTVIGLGEQPITPWISIL